MLLIRQRTVICAQARWLYLSRSLVDWAHPLHLKAIMLPAGCLGRSPQRLLRCGVW